jgi:uncharacterized small protein (TIGR04563 family)
MAANGKHKQSLYFPTKMLEEIKREAARLDRSLSWVLQTAWQTSRREIMNLPSANADVAGAAAEGSEPSRQPTE